jgi:glycosyltransferase involved in cell wall biosynthesis
MKINDTISDVLSFAGSATTAPALPVRRSPALPKPTDVKDLICFSHLRWNFVYQRPQHLLNRASRQYRLWFIEEPVWGDEQRVEIRAINDRLHVVVPHLKHGTEHKAVFQIQRVMVDELIQQQKISDFIVWYYTPMALRISHHLKPLLTVYDAMDELSAFKGAPPQLLDLEKDLIGRANIVFTGGYSLYEAKRHRHPHVFAFPSSIDYAHFATARQSLPDPADQQHLPRPRLGFAGVIDERFDIDLMRDLIDRRPDWQFIFLGPVVKIKRETLPQGPNVHYLGMKKYEELPAYFSNWDVALLPFALNESTRYISPTKTPEYLAAGLPSVSTPIRDVVRTYGNADFVQVAATADAFEQAIEKALNKQHPADWVAIDEFLADNSWDKTWQDMNRLLQAQLQVVVEQ